MNCPVCKDVQLAMADRQGIEIDYCPNCRGVWLDRGELDRIIERSLPEATSTSPSPRQDNDRDDRRDYREAKDSREYQKDYDKKRYDKHKRKSFLSELFDF